MTEPPPPPTAPDEASPRDLTELMRLLDLEELDRDLFRASNPEGQPRFRLFGGQVAAQAMRAAGLTVPEGRWPHSLHGYFLRSGAADRPTLLHVDRDRDGRSFTARHVVARQNGDAIFSMLASFQAVEDATEHQELQPPTPVPDPDELDPGGTFPFGSMFDVRPITLDERPNRPGGLSSRFWARCRGSLPDDRLLHACVLTYLSDIGTGFFKVPIDVPMGGASLDHAVWFHRAVRMDDWVLVDLEPVVGSGGRAYYTGAVWNRDDELVASIAEEHLWRSLPAFPTLPGP